MEGRARDRSRSSATLRRACNAARSSRPMRGIAAGPRPHPESPQELRGGAIAGAKRRHANYQAAVAERGAEADRANTRPKDAQGDLED